MIVKSIIKCRIVGADGHYGPCEGHGTWSPLASGLECQNVGQCNWNLSELLYITTDVFEMCKGSGHVFASNPGYFALFLRAIEAAVCSLYTTQITLWRSLVQGLLSWRFRGSPLVNAWYICWVFFLYCFLIIVFKLPNPGGFILQFDWYGLIYNNFFTMRQPVLTAKNTTNMADVMSTLPDVATTCFLLSYNSHASKIVEKVNVHLVFIV